MLFPTAPAAPTSSVGAHRSLRASVLGMLLAPLVPWFSLPIPFIVFLVYGLAALPIVVATPPPEPVVASWYYAFFEILGLLLPITAVLTFAHVRKQAWGKALWSSLVFLGSGVTVLATFLMITGGGAVEPWGFVSPAALLVFAAIPASRELADRWAAERGGGIDSAAALARMRLMIVALGFAVAIGLAFAASFAWAAVTIESLPSGHFYWEEQAIREGATGVFTIVAVPILGVFLFLVRRLLTPAVAAPESLLPS